jgi:hypothetical protein
MANGTLYCLTASSTDFKYSTDNGVTWTTGTLPSASSSSTFRHCIDFDGTNYVYIKGTTTVYYGTTLAFGSTATISSSPTICYVVNSNFILSDLTGSGLIWYGTDPASFSSKATTFSIGTYMLYAHSKYFAFGDSVVASASTLGGTWTSEIASGITATSATAMPQTFACASGNNLVFISSGVINIYQSGSWTAVTNAQQNTGLATLSLGVANVFTKVRN